MGKVEGKMPTIINLTFYKRKKAFINQNLSTEKKVHSSFIEKRMKKKNNKNKKINKNNV